MTPIDMYALLSICLNLRDEDKAEIYGLRDHDNPIKLAGEAYYVLYHKGRGSIAWHNGQPVAVIGFYERWPGCWEAVSFGTEHYKAVGVDLMRYGRKLARELLSSDLGARRLQADSRIDNEQAHAFIRVLGGKPEGPPMRSYGRDGADYQRFVWLRADGDAQLVGLQA
jgi:RimJ/RimL family protein N-acetyltransferase